MVRTELGQLLYFTTTLSSNVSGKIVERIRVNSVGDPNQSLLMGLPASVISTLESDPNITNINYKIYRQFVTTITAGAQTIDISTSRSNEEMLDGSFSDKYLVTCVAVNNGTDDEVAAHEGRLIALTRPGESPGPIEYPDNNDKTKVRLNLSEPVPNDMSIKIIAPVQVTNAKAKRKFLRREKNFRAEYNASNPFDPVTSPASIQSISLEKADIYKLNSVTMILPDNTEVDVTDNYILDDGQRDDMYGIGNLFRNVTAPTATGPLIIDFEYFEHDSDGDFFSVDSYTHDDGVLYKNIPVYKGTIMRTEPEQIKRNPTEYTQLRDCIDFRSVVNTGGPFPSTISIIDVGKPSEECTNYRTTKNAGTGSVNRVPMVGSTLECDIQHYQPKIDSVFLDCTGNISVVEGIPAEFPIRPDDLSTGIRLYDMYIPAYTFEISDIQTTKYNYRRYTMNDIDDINNRLTKVQDLVTLSLLEQDAVKLSIRDPNTGLDRFKNGVVVDPFRDHKYGDVGTDQYRNSVDSERSHLRAPFEIDQINLEERNQTDSERSTFGNYRNNDDIITCEYDSIEFIKQGSATRFINLQPYTVFTFEGGLRLFPSIDTFQEINILPDLVVRDNSVWDAMRGLSNGLRRMGTVWGDWATTNVTEIGNFRRGQPRLLNPDLPPTRQTRSGRTIPNWRLRTTTEQIRTGLSASLRLGNATTVNTSFGERVVDTKVARTMRSIAVRFIARRMKPNTRVYAFFGGVDVNNWVSADRMITNEDGERVYQGPPNGRPAGFGKPLITDDYGNLTGLFLVPNGRAPVEGQIFRGNVNRLRYRTNGPSRRFNTGSRGLLLTSTKLRPVAGRLRDLSLVDTFARRKFTSSGVILDKQETIVSTRVPENPSISFNPSNETREIVRERPFDPVAQTFKVEKEHPDGVFLSEIDVFFQTKDLRNSVEVYLVTTTNSYPTQEIIPHSRVVKNPNSVLRVTCDLGSLSTARLSRSIVVVGETSKASGTLRTTRIFESASVNSEKNVDNSVYNLILDNYKGEFLPNERIVPKVSPTLSATFRTVKDEVELVRIDMKELGSGYTLENTTVTVSEPELPGGVRATASLKIAQNHIFYTDGKDGQVYQIELTDPGSGYTKAPSIQITGDGSPVQKLYQGFKNQLGLLRWVLLHQRMQLYQPHSSLMPLYIYWVTLNMPLLLRHRIQLSTGFIV